MANTISGKIHLITDVQEIKGKSGNSFYKRQLVIDAKRYDPITGEPKYDNYPSFEFSGEAMKQLDDYKVGDAVTVSYDINGREVKDENGKLIIEPLEEQKEEDLPIDTPCMVADNNYPHSLALRYYAGNKRVFYNGERSCESTGDTRYDIIIPWNKFNPNDIEESLKHNIVKS